jgi:hypothetical protein
MEQEHKGGNHVMVDQAELMLSQVPCGYGIEVAAWHFASRAGLGSWRCGLLLAVTASKGIHGFIMQLGT